MRLSLLFVAAHAASNRDYLRLAAASRRLSRPGLLARLAINPDMIELGEAAFGQDGAGLPLAQLG